MNEVINDLTSLGFHGWYKTWESFMKKYKCETICEVGVRTGLNFGRMIRHNPKMAVAVDIWKDDKAPEEMEKQYNNLKKTAAEKSFVKVYREYSHDAVRHFPDEYFDFIYIDADHTLESCFQDITDWYPKVKKGKFLLGDDYRKLTTSEGSVFGVIEAVNKFAAQNKLGFFVFPEYQWGIIKT